MMMNIKILTIKI